MTTGSSGDTPNPGQWLNIAEQFLVERLREGRGDRVALRVAERDRTYAEVDRLVNRFGNALLARGVRPEERVIVALPDGAEYVGALFGILKVGAVAVMVNPGLAPEGMAAMVDLTRARVAVVDPEVAVPVTDPLVAGPGDGEALEHSDELETARTHRDDPAIWLFTGGTTGVPKAAVQTHASFANTTLCYAHKAMGWQEDDITLAVPKLYFGYATGSNLFFPFSVGASAALFPEHPTAEVVFERIARHRPTILVNVPKMVAEMVAHPSAPDQDLSCLRFATSAGEALPPTLHERWNDTFGVPLYDGLGTAEMWHIFVSNQPGAVRPGSLGRAVPGFDVRVCDDEGNEMRLGEVGRLWVRGASRALGYWQDAEKSADAFRGEWFAASDMVRKDTDGYFHYVGRSRRRPQGRRQVAAPRRGGGLPAGPPGRGRGGGGGRPRRRRADQAGRLRGGRRRRRGRSGSRGSRCGPAGPLPRAARSLQGPPPGLRGRRTPPHPPGQG